VSLPNFTKPDFSRPVDVEGHLAALSEDACARGFYFIELLKRLEARVPGFDPFAELGLQRAEYRSFKEYSYRDYLQINVLAAQKMFPQHPVGEGLRRLGHGAYDVFVATQIGRVLIGAVGKNFARIAKLGCRAYSTSLNFGKVEWTELGEKEGYYTFTDFPALIDTYQLGVVEGAMKAVGTTGEVQVAMEDVTHGYLHVRWD
jgi:uncharacterized protein (TIGR02265 family)